MPLNTIQTVIFDNDGVNINSENLAMRICDDWLSQMVERFMPNSPLPQNYIYSKFAGKSTNKIAALIIEEKSLPMASVKETYGFTDKDLLKIKIAEGLAHDDDLGAVSFALADLITAATIDGFKKDLKAIYGITQMHEDIRGLVGEDHIYLATTSRADRMDVSLGYAIDPATGENACLLQTFKEGLHRLSGYGKPNKYDLLFNLAEEAGEPIDPNTAIIVEDSLSGVRYAKEGRDGLRVIGTAAADFFPYKEKHARELITAGASAVVTDMRDLPSIMKWLDTGLDFEQKPKALNGEVFTSADFIDENKLNAGVVLGNALAACEVK